MRRALGVGTGCIALGIALPLMFPVVPSAASGGPVAPWVSEAAAPEGFVGAPVCGSCHTDQFAAWQTSTHGQAGGAPDSVDLLPLFDGSAIRFADAVVRPTILDSGGYGFIVHRPQRDSLVLELDGVIGGGHMVGGGTQGFVSRFPDGTLRFLPFDFSRQGDVWFCNTAFVAGFWVPGAERARLPADEGWVPITPEMKLTDCGDWPPVRVLGTEARFANCQNCHGSQVELEFEPAEATYVTDFSSLKINCESCHGAGADHVELARSGALAQSPDLGFPALDTLGVDGSLGVCFQCHAIKRELDEVATDEVWAAAAPVLEQYSLGLPAVGDQPFLPDGRIASFAYQQNHRLSTCYLSGAMTCVSCHEPHSQTYRDAFGTPLAGRFDDGQCLSCHASKAQEPARHSFHPSGPEGVSCVSCHMPYLQQPGVGDQIPYGRSDHTIPIPRPGFDEGLGIESACAQCHTDRTTDELAIQVREWWGILKPHRPSTAALLAVGRSRVGSTEPSPGVSALAGVALSAAADEGSSYGLSKIMALDAWVAAVGWGFQEEARLGGLSDSVGIALAMLARDSDLDVAAVALGVLHVVRGDDADVRRFIDEVGGGMEARPELRVRWAKAILQWAQTARGSVGDEAHVALLERAQEVRPSDSSTLLALASGLADAGRLDDAVQMYLAALQVDPSNALALVNVGQVQ